MPSVVHIASMLMVAMLSAVILNFFILGVIIMINDHHYVLIMLNIIAVNVIILSYVCNKVKYNNAISHNAKCHYAECLHAEGCALVQLC